MLWRFNFVEAVHVTMESVAGYDGWMDGWTSAKINKLK